jgi:hypothetical protein
LSKRGRMRISAQFPTRASALCSTCACPARRVCEATLRMP